MTLASILAAIQAIPQILSLSMNFIKFFESKFGTDWGKAVQDVNAAFTLLNQAKTEQDYQNAASALARSFNRNN